MTTLSRRDSIILLCLITLMGAVLRFYSLGRNSLWLDEFSSWYIGTRDSISEAMKANLQYELTPPVYFVIQYVFGHMFEQTEFGVRFSSAVAGTLSIPAIYLLAQEVFDRLSGIISALVFATAYQAIYYSQEARAYSLVILLSALSTWKFFSSFKAVQEGRNAFRDNVMYVAFAGLLALTHYFGALLVFVQGILWLAVAGLSRRKFALWLKVYSAVSFCFLAWIAFAIPKLLHFPSTDGPLCFHQMIDFNRWLFGSSSVYGLLSTLSIVAMMAASYFSGDQNSEPSSSSRMKLGSAFWLLIFGPFILVLAISQYRPFIYSPRYMVIALVPMYVLIGASLADIGQRYPRLKWFMATSVIAFTCLGLHETIFARHTYDMPKAEQTRESVEWFKNVASKRYPDSILGTSAFIPGSIDYYLTALETGRKVDIWTPVANIEEIRAKTKVGARHLIFFAPGFADTDNDIVTTLKKVYPLELAQPFYRASVWIFALP